ncbi:LBF_1199 family protein [Leptospira sp. 'Mane']|uniref:LBF_1199 family protein n=1 Tax=Leptospira sp. 'Mane' TaxID=3387407 RepID=UPI00398B8196
MNASPLEMINFFRQIHEDCFLKDWVEAFHRDDSLVDLVFEYLWLYRSEPETRILLNNSDFPPWLLLRFIYFGYGKQILQGHFDSNIYFAQVKVLIDSDQSLRVLSLAEDMDKDPTLKIHLLANLDAKTWESYFDILEQNEKTIHALVGIFINLKEQEIRTILLNSPTLYIYLRLMLVSRKIEDEEVGDEKAKILKDILEGIREWELFATNLKDKFDLITERKQIPKERDSKRISLILYELIKVGEEDRAGIISYLKGSHVILDEWEESIIRSTLANYKQFGTFI